MGRKERDGAVCLLVQTFRNRDLPLSLSLSLPLSFYPSGVGGRVKGGGGRKEGLICRANSALGSGQRKEKESKKQTDKPSIRPLFLSQ